MKKLPVFFDKFIYLLIIFNLISMVVESEPDLSIEVKNYLSNFEIFSIAIFTVEYIIRSIVCLLASLYGSIACVVPSYRSADCPGVI